MAQKDEAVGKWGNPLSHRRKAEIGDINGSRFGALVAVREVGLVQGHTQWLCACDCGAGHVVRLSHLINGKTRSCGCLQHQGIDLVDQEFGRWVVIRASTRQEWLQQKARKDRKASSDNDLGDSSWFWLCRCACGAEKIISGQVLRKGESRGCRRCHNKDITESREPGVSVGQVFGRLTVIDARCEGGRALCRCSCGTESRPFWTTLFSGRVVSCGCHAREKLAEWRASDDMKEVRKRAMLAAQDARRARCTQRINAVIGLRYGRAVVVAEAPKKGHSRRVEIICDCGATTTREFSSLARRVSDCGQWCPLRRRVPGAATCHKWGVITRLFRPGLALDTIIKQRPQKSQRRRPESVV